MCDSFGFDLCISFGFGSCDSLGFGLGFGRGESGMGLIECQLLTLLLLSM